jgi:hypothetical protein
MFTVGDKTQTIKRCELSTVLVAVHASFWFGGCVYSLDCLVDVIPMLVFIVCGLLITIEFLIQFAMHEVNDMKVINAQQARIIRQYKKRECKLLEDCDYAETCSSKLILKYAICGIVHLLVLVEFVIEFFRARNAQNENALLTFKNPAQF